MLRAKPIAILAAAILVILVAAVIARLVISPDEERTGANEPEALHCEGLIAHYSPDYSTLAEAEAAFGFPLPDVHTPGWSFQGASVVNYSEDSGRQPEAGEFVGAVVGYACDDFLTLTLLIFPPGRIESVVKEFNGVDITANRVPARLLNREGEMRRDPPGLVVFWQEAGRDYMATCIIHSEFTEADCLALIDSLQ